MLFDESADCANQVVTLGLSDRVQPLDDPTVVVIGSFEGTIGDQTELVETLLKGFPNDVVCVQGSTCVKEGKYVAVTHCTRT